MKSYTESPSDREPLKVEEPLAAYGMNSLQLDSDLSIVSEARKGIRTSMLWDFLKTIKSSKSDFEALLPSSLKTFSRKKILDEATGERILNIIKVYMTGEQVFGDIDQFKLWLQKYNPVLGAEPVAFLTTTTGCQVVINELRRAQHGIMA